MLQPPEFLISTGPLLTIVAALMGIWFAITAICVPGTGVPEVGGLISLIAASAGVLYLEANLGGALLLAAAISLFLAQLYYRHVWPLPVIGFLLQAVGSFFLFNANVRPSLLILIIFNLLTVVYYYLILKPGLRIQDRPEAVGGRTLIGEMGEVVSTLEPAGTIRVQGTIWRARADQVIPSGARVQVIGRNGLELQVVPGEPEYFPATSTPS
jgi:membrane-bound serine protease (ClpP class)